MNINLRKQHKRINKIRDSEQYSNIEIGNLLFGHSRGNYSVDRNLEYRFVKFLESIGYDSYGCENDEFTGKRDNRFTVRPYYWGDDDSEESNLPNFECEEIGLELRWYKYPLRDAYSNIQFDEKIIQKLEKMIG